MAIRHYLGIADYLVIASSLLISVLIGILFRFSGGKQKTMMEYVMAGKNMAKFPVILSITVSMTSASTMLANPSEVYRYGTQYVIKSFGLAIGMILSSYIFVPVYFQCGVSTVYEYLEMRFGKLTRYTISAGFVIHMFLLMSVVLYSAVLALSAVTNLSFEMSVITVGVCCTFYSSLGGLKAVLWTDVFQCFLMCSCVVVVCTFGIGDIGGISNVFNISSRGQRLQLFNFSTDLTTRYTFWNTLLRGICAGFCYYGTGQVEVQRMLSLRNCDRAKSVLRMSVLPVMCFHILCDFMGLIMYGVYHSCDPLLNRNQTGLTKYDQMIPYYIVTRMGSIPGLTGLCVAGLFSGSLSSLSSAINSLATVTVVDFLKPFIPSLTEKRSVWLAKGLSLLYGVICICCALCLSSVSSIRHVSMVFLLLEGPLIAVFSIGVLTRKASDKCMTFGFLASLPIIVWISFGGLIGGYKEPPLPVDTSMCSSGIPALNRTVHTLIGNSTLGPKEDYSNLSSLYKLSFLWTPVLGTLLCLIITFTAIVVTGWRNNVIASDSKCLSPVTRLWFKNTYHKDNNEIPDSFQYHSILLSQLQLPVEEQNEKL